MGYEELLDVIGDSVDFETINKLALERSPMIQRLINDFIFFYEEKYGVVVTLTADDIVMKLSQAYILMVHMKVKPLVDERINCYKMGALMELLIVKEQVLIHPESETDSHLNKTVNALFGMTASFSLINCMITTATKEFHFDSLNHQIDLRVKSILDNHKKWLETKELNDMPIIINGQFFELIHVLHTAPYIINGF